MDKLLMSRKELSRWEVMQRLAEKRMSQPEAGRSLNLSTHQIKRLLKAYRQLGATGWVCKQPGRNGNNRLAEEVKRRGLNLLKTKYKGFGSTLAYEKLVEREKLQLSDESVRQLMIEEGWWKPRKAKKLVIHQRRERRACFGELIQIDGSPHDWFEGRAESCVLLVFIDDATGKLVQLLFVESESFFRAVEGYFRQSGKPVAFYSDHHGIFRVNVPSTGSGEALTQFGRTLQELDIQIICANSPQVRGRVERLIQTLQDRLPTPALAGAAYLPQFIPDFNQRFAVQARSAVNAHRPLTAPEDLARILTRQQTRSLSKNLTLQFQKTVYQLPSDCPTYALRKAHVTLGVNPQAEITILYHAKALAYTLFKHLAKQAQIVSIKQLDRALNAMPLPPTPPPDHPCPRRHSIFGLAGI